MQLILSLLIKLKSAILLLLAVTPLSAAVLPEDRSDALYHAYDGGGVEVSGPSILIRKQVGSAVSVSANYYTDSISSASVDVVTTASPYSEYRREHSFSVDYLHHSTIMTLGYNNSEESDYTSNTASFGISQEMFGAMTTVSLSYSRSADEVRKTGDEQFKEDVKRQSYRLGITQVLSTNALMSLTWETISDQGFLNNPYRSVRYIDTINPKGYAFEPERYPGTRSSNTLAIRGIYYLPYRASLSAEYRYFSDSWGIQANNTELAYVHPLGERWTVDLKYRYYQQSAADFYSDIFSTQGYQNHLARDKELSTFNSHTFSVGASFAFLKENWSLLERGDVSFTFDYIQFNYDDFRDISGGGVAGQESLYDFGAKVIRLFVSVWY